MPDPTILYSTATLLAYRIAKLYYSDIHYVWCSPVFDGRRASAYGHTVPPTSSPCEIYWGLHQEASRGDRHSAKISDNRTGIIRGAQAKRARGVVDEETERQIIAATELATPADFKPVLFVMPFGRVKRLIHSVPVQDRAHPLSAEYLIPELPGRLFDVIEFGNA